MSWEVWETFVAQVANLLTSYSDTRRVKVNIWLTKRRFWLMEQIHVFQIIFFPSFLIWIMAFCSNTFPPHRGTWISYKSYILAVNQKKKPQVIKQQKLSSSLSNKNANTLSLYVFTFWLKSTLTCWWNDFPAQQIRLTEQLFCPCPTNSTITEQ